jgi:pimeloyl-ACP methyl ester carboxylesterase
MRRGCALTTVAMLLLICAPAAAAAPSTRRAGTLTLHRCAMPDYVNGLAWCGTVMRPLDPGLPHGPRIPIRFRWIPADQRPVGTIVAVSGGPGGATIAARDEYTSTFPGSLFNHNLLLIDNRGTGTSGALSCPAFQRTGYNTNGFVPTPTAQLARIVGRCGAALNHRFRAPGGGYVHASDLYSSAYAVGDMAAILTDLRTGPVTLYGDSYGSAFIQSFIAWHPKLVKAAVLDSAYPVRDPDPWWTPTAVAARRALTRVCERSAGCDMRGGGTLTRFSALVARVRRHPLHTYWIASAGGRRVRQTIGVAQLFELFTDAGFDPTILRDLDPAVRAAMDGDGTPLARLLASSTRIDNSRIPARFLSDELFAAVWCTEVPQPYSMNAPPATREHELQAGIEAQPPGSFAPFTAPEWARYFGLGICLRWPRPQDPLPVVSPTSAPLPASVPILVVGGDLDSVTSAAVARSFAPTLGADVTFVDLRNATHVTSAGGYPNLGDGSNCGDSIITRFIDRPRALRRVDTSCASRIPPIQTVAAYPGTFAAAPAATVVTGHASRTARRAAWVAAQAAGDAAFTFLSPFPGGRVGPWGGAVVLGALGPDRKGPRLDGYRFVIDAAATGTFTQGIENGVIGTITVRYHGVDYPVHVSWSQRSRYARATIAGAILKLPAPGP